jgi:CCR4-NOT transcription complex subunit 9
MYRPQLGQQPSFSEGIPGTENVEEDKVYQYILDLTNPTTRELALLELSKKREAYEDLAPILWYSFGFLC